MPETFPNQRMVKVHRERATANFLGIKNWRNFDTNTIDAKSVLADIL